MNGRVRLMADARSLFWPWCIVAGAGVLSLFRLHRLPGGLEPEVLAGIGFCIGVPLLATLSFGNEFQFGTFSSLLSQPIERSRIWREKSAVIVIAVLSAAIAYAFGADRMGWGTRDITVAALWLMVTVGSSAYWTLVARSTIGGLVLNGLQSMALVLVFVPQLNKEVDAYSIRSAGSEVLLAIGGFATAYTAVMLYLGRRKLLRFQVTGSAGSDSNVLATDWTATPNPLRKLLRCTASGGALNLVRKELHLLWPLAPVTFVACGSLLAVAPLRFVSGYHGWIVTVGISIILMHALFAAILAGALSFAEERSLGLHTWNMTQPISVVRLWAIKLITGLFTSAACAGAVILLAHLLYGPAFLQEFAPLFDVRVGMPYLALFPLLAFIPFWCAAGVNGTVRAAFWCLPAAGAVLAAYDFGMSSGMSNIAAAIVRTLTEAVHPFPFTAEWQAMTWRLTWVQRGLIDPPGIVIPALWANVWLLLPAAIQSYRLFRSEIREGIMPLIRQTLFLAGVGFLCGFLQHVPVVAAGTMGLNTVRVLEEISEGVAAMRIDPTAVRSEAGYTVTLETISNSVALSDRTRTWLETDTLVIRPANKDPWLPEQMVPRYIITAELHGGWKCTFADNFFEFRRTDRGIRLYVCKSPQGTLGGMEADR